ncbi:hypothetical protein F3Y22_tig00004072pilonHSYRG00327 [Hibiscus syriacus]|uniref:RING-type domain-containing protein n=1 Tax=Hibiscus syriacus TaxID=106335 RepID=A0A6A3CNZ6_HIBSY|nr:nuclear factor 7, ovary-like [Hibiscus syriacus]KAE8728849.1 hypothetical protein F3Y22_tig00004072pilonHSYRG00327 [Hibiscus syriacus]
MSQLSLMFAGRDMDVVDKERRRRRSFKERLGFKVMGCCGSNWGFRSTTLSLKDEGEVEIEEQVAATDSDPGLTPPSMEANGGDRADEKEKGTSVEPGSDSMCCVCMERKKGAALIPCGHTFCRVCSRLLWVNRGSCPLCNRSILDILDISPCSRSIRQILDIF